MVSQQTLIFCHCYAPIRLDSELKAELSYELLFLMSFHFPYKFMPIPYTDYK
jgi:hypothetical protein